MKEILKYSGCFVCGDKNDNGLQAKFYYDGKEASTEIEASDNFEGYQKIYHGGIISTVLDEVMVKAILAKEIYAVTVEMTVRFHKPVRTGDKLFFKGRIVKNKGRVYFTEGEVKRTNGDILATASGKYIEAEDELKNQLMKSIE
ncbi:MAG: PaaI family thioesterase [candidate division Zixibacteria bacterium]|nr:PaaI family thioesterase [candidate division Zixibacteria bacterium]